MSYTDMSQITASLLTFFQNRGSGSLKNGSKLVVACSGGPDSVALVHGLKEVSHLLPYKFIVAHVNHQLRGRESEKDAKFVRTLAQKINWPFYYSIQPAKPMKNGNLEEIARDKRYRALGQIAAKTRSAMVLTAHTIDDQVETVLMNLIRGVGQDGLGGMWPVRYHKVYRFYVGRPFLEIEKSDILRYLKTNGFLFRQDKSNLNRRFQRNWLRHEIVPQLKSRAPGFQKRVGQLASILREENSYWSEFLTRLNTKLLRPYRKGGLLDFKRLLRYSPAVQRRFLRHVLGGDLLSFEAVENLRRWMAGPPTGGRLWQLRKGWTVERLSKSSGSPSTSIFWLRKIQNKHHQTSTKKRRR